MRVKLFLLVAVGLLAFPLGANALGSTTKYTPPNLSFTVKGPAKVIGGELTGWRIIIRNMGNADRRRVVVKYLLDKGVTYNPATKPKPYRVLKLASNQEMVVWHLNRVPAKTSQYINSRANMPAQYAFSDYCMPVEVFWKGIIIGTKTQRPCPPFVSASDG